MSLEEQIRAEVEGRQHTLHIDVDRYTPTGRLRSQPIYSAFIRNDFLGKERLVKGRDPPEVKRKCGDQLLKWEEEEIRLRVRGANADAKARAEAECEDLSRDASTTMAALRNILNATLSVDDRIDWNQLADREPFPAFNFAVPKPRAMPHPLSPDPLPKSFWEWLLPSKKRKREEQDAQNLVDHQRFCASLDAKNARELSQWTAQRDEELAAYEAMKQRYLRRQEKRNSELEAFRRRFEEGDADAICEYLGQVFERSDYPEVLYLEHVVTFEASSLTAVIDLTLPAPEDIPDVVEYKFVKSKLEAKPVSLKKKEHEALYDLVLYQIALRTIHEVFESVYTPHVQACVVNGWVTSLNRATGIDETSCIYSVTAERRSFETINLARVDAHECFKSLKGLVAGPLAQLAPVKPILHLNRQDARFVEAKEVLAEVNSHANLAEIPWQDFEHLVRELFAKEFCAENAEVRVTQSSRDGGVDAVAFDPDPIRGGKFVIQAKRFTKNVPVSAVRDLYGTMIHEGAGKGILVTTSHYGRDARKFASDKPITLIDGNQLVYLLEKHGHKVRIDITEAKAKRLAERAAAEST